MVLKYLSSNEVGESNDETNFTHKLLLTNTQVSKTFEAFTNGSSADVKFPKNQLSKMVQSGGFLGKLFEPLLKTGLPLKVNLLKLLAKSLFCTLRINDSSVSNRWSYSKVKFWIRNNNINIFK